LTGLVDGRYTVSPSKAGYAFSPVTRSFWLGGADARRKNFTATALVTAYRISGRVSGATAEGVTLTLSRAAAATTTTAADGTYAFTGLASGAYTVTPSKPGYTFTPVSRSFSVSGANATGKNFTATAVATTHRIAGTVSGATAQGVTLALGGAASDATTTAADGTYAFTGLQDGGYTVTPSKVGFTFTPASLSFSVSGADATGRDFAATSDSTAYGIAGTVSGATAQGVTLTLGGAASATTTSAADGSYAFTGLQNGSYTVTPSREGYAFSPSSLSLELGGGDATGKDFVATATSSTTPVLDAGFPKCTWIDNRNTPSMTIGPFTTSGPRTYVATVSFYTPANDPYPLSLTWVGGAPGGASTWTRRTWPNDPSIHWTAEIWTATATGGLAGVQVDAARAHLGDASTSILCVYAYSGVSGIGAVADHHSPMRDVGAHVTGPYTVTIDAQAANSQIVGISQGGDTYVPFTPNALTTIDYQQNDGGADGGAASWRKTTPTSGPGGVTLGCTDADLAFAVEAIELLAAP